MLINMPTILKVNISNHFQWRNIILRLFWLVIMSLAFAELFFLGHHDPVAYKAYIVVLCATIVIAGNLIYPDKLLSRLQPARRFLIWSIILACIAFFSLLLGNNIKTDFSTCALMALAVFNLSFFMCCTGHLFMATNKGSHPAQMTFTMVMVLTTLPVWLGPLIDSLPLYQGVIDLIISASPLTHLAAMADFDYLRSQWFYEHTPYGTIQYSYPTKLGLSICYSGLSLALLWASAFIEKNASFHHNNIHLQGEK